MKVLMTGATGMLGRHLYARLVGMGYSVVNIRRFDDPLEAFELHRPEIVYHLATHYVRSHQPEDLAPMIEANIALPLRVLDAMREFGVKRFVNAASAWQHSWNGQPVCLHSAAKLAAQDLIKYYADAHKINVMNLYLNDTYSPDDERGKLLSLCAHWKPGDAPIPCTPGYQELDLVHVDDVVEAFVHAGALLLAGASFFQSAYVTSGQTIPLRKIVAAFQAQNGGCPEIAWGARHYHKREVMRHTIGTPLVGWAPKIGLEEMFRNKLGVPIES